MRILTLCKGISIDRAKKLAKELDLPDWEVRRCMWSSCEKDHGDIWVIFSEGKPMVRVGKVDDRYVTLPLHSDDVIQDYWGSKWGPI